MALNIIAVTYISLSEIQTVKPWVDEKFVEDYPDEFREMLYELGADVFNYPTERQDTTHKNRFNNVVTCARWVCNERLDAKWIKSGHASIEARDKSLNNKLLIESYKSRGLVEVV